MAYKSRAKLLAENKRLRAQAAGKGKGTKKAIFKNVVGYPCQSAYTANSSSRKIVRHLREECGCDKSRGFSCKAKKNLGQTYATLGSKPNAHWTPLA